MSHHRREVWIQYDGQEDVETVAGWVPGEVQDTIYKEDQEYLSVQLQRWSDIGCGNELDDEIAEFYDKEIISVVVNVSKVLERNVYEVPPEDLVQLIHLHDPAILRALMVRFRGKCIYTWCGPILLAVNPFENLNTYSVEKLKKYEVECSKDTSMEPHVFAIAGNAYASLFNKGGANSSGKNQSVLISGESGAGKTESTKFVMRYLAYVSGTAAHHEIDLKLHDTSRDYSIEQKILESNPILEAFGNARTIRNDNSSRFGKFIQMYFNDNQTLVGACISTYLLEKVRITQQHPDERLYHIFYQMLFGASDEEKRSWFWEVDADIEDFDLLAGRCSDRRDGVSDAEEFEATRCAMKIMGISSDDQSNVLRIVAALLHLGNIVFSAESEEASSIDASEPRNSQALSAIESLLGIGVEDLQAALCTRTVHARQEVIVTHVTKESAQDTRDALARYIYAMVFEWLVARVNDSIKPKKQSKKFIAILDIFGFEIFKENSFEQLCINYANERLQQQFNDFVFQHEQRIYSAENIQWSFIDFPSNIETVNLIGGGNKPGLSVLSILDDECRLPKGTDAGFVNKTYDAFKAHSAFSVSNSQRVNLQFVIEHYAGSVVYDSYGFCDKNRDQLRQEALTLISEKASNSFLRGLHKAPATSKSERRGDANNRNGISSDARKSSIALKSVSADFKHGLTSLLETIDQTSPHYIRCIKPNDLNQAMRFDKHRVEAQLRCGGVLQAVRVARAGFPVRMSHKDFLIRYGKLCGSAARKLWVQDESSKFDRTLFRSITSPGFHKESPAEIHRLVTSFSVLLPADISDFIQVGKTRMFLRKVSHDNLERWMSIWSTKARETVFRYLIGNHNYTAYHKLKNNTLKIQSMVRGWLARRKTQNIRRNIAALSIQSWIRGRFYAIAYQQIRGMVIGIQCFVRVVQSRKQYRRLRTDAAISILQRWFRGSPLRGRYVKFRGAVIKLQCAERRKLAKRVLREMRIQAKDLNSVQVERDRLRARVAHLEAQLKDLSTTATQPSMSHDHVVPRIAPLENKEIQTTPTKIDRSKMIIIGSLALVALKLLCNLRTINKMANTKFAEDRERSQVYSVQTVANAETMSKNTDVQGTRVHDSQYSSFTLEFKDTSDLHFDETDECPSGCVSPCSNRVGELEAEVVALREELRTQRQISEAQLEESRAGLGKIINLKNVAEMRQGEIQLELMMMKKASEETARGLEAMKIERDEAVFAFEKFKLEVDEMNQAQKSSAVMALEQEIQQTRVELSTTAVKLEESLKKLAASKNQLAEADAKLEFQSHALADMRDTFRENESTSRKKFVESLIQVKLQALLDRKHLKLESCILSAWKYYVASCRRCKDVILARWRAIRKDYLIYGWSRWSENSSRLRVITHRSQRHQDRQLFSSKNAVFTRWRQVVARSHRSRKMDDIFAQRNFNRLCMPVFHAWKSFAQLNIEEEYWVDHMTRVFKANVARRLFRSWKHYTMRVRNSKRKLYAFILAQSKRQLSDVFMTLQIQSRVDRSRSKDADGDSLLAHLYRQLDASALKIAALEKREAAHIDLLTQITPKSTIRPIPPRLRHRTPDILQNTEDPEQEMFYTPERKTRKSIPKDSQESGSSVPVSVFSASETSSRPSYLSDDEFEGDETPRVVNTDSIKLTAASVSMPPLIVAIQHGLHEGMVQLLIEGEDPNGRDLQNNTTPLHEAVFVAATQPDTSLQLIRTLVQYGAKVDMLNSEGNTPLIEAAIIGDPAIEVAEELILHGALHSDHISNEYGQNPLHKAIRRSDVRMVTMLLDQGIDPAWVDRQGQTPLHHAARLCNSKMIEILLGYPSTLKYDANMRPIDLLDTNGNSVLHLVCSGTSEELPRCIFLLLGNDANPNQVNVNSQSPLHVLCNNKHASINALLHFQDSGVDLAARDFQGNTALHIACQMNNRDFALTLVKWGAPLFARNLSNETPLKVTSPGFGVNLLSAIVVPPNKTLVDALEKSSRACSICQQHFRVYAGYKICSHCGRKCCSTHAKNSFPISKFDMLAPVPLCDHCFGILTMK